MNDKEIQRLEQAEKTTQLRVCHNALDLIEAEDRVVLLKSQLKAATNDLLDIRKSLREAKTR